MQRNDTGQRSLNRLESTQGYFQEMGDHPTSSCKHVSPSQWEQGPSPSSKTKTPTMIPQMRDQFWFCVFSLLWGWECEVAMVDPQLNPIRLRSHSSKAAILVAFPEEKHGIFNRLLGWCQASSWVSAESPE